MSKMLKKCEELARDRHAGQFRKFGADKDKPYIIHPERIVEKMNGDFNKCVAWIHDVLEDTTTTRQDLVALGIDATIIYAAVSLSKEEGENYLDFILRIKENDLAVPIKIADIEDNMISLKEGSLKDKYRMALYILKGDA